MRRTLLQCVLRGLLLLPPAVGVVACGDASLAPLPLSITIEASRGTAATGETVDFVVNARGGTLIGIEIDYGDGAIEQYGTSGARTARVRFDHAYAAAGAYRVQAVVTDAVAGTKDASVEVRIQ